MTAIIYFGEMLVASLLAIVLLAISQLRMSPQERALDFVVIGSIAPVVRMALRASK
jgi:hypothetical protein